MAYTMEYPTKDLFHKWIDGNALDNVCLNDLGTIPFSKYGQVAFPVPLLNFNNLLLTSPQLVGIDIPVLIHPEKEKCKGETLVIVGQSPLREVICTYPKDSAFIGCPFAVNNVLGIPKQCCVYKLIFQKLLDCGYTLYLTDAVKVWWEGKKLVPNYQKQAPNNNRVSEIFYDETFFINEMLKFPKANIKGIITWGNIAKHFVKEIANYNQLPPIIPVMHPGKRNWGRWKKCLNGATANNSPIDRNNCQNGKALCTASLVSDLVAKEILNKLQQIKKN